ncbi:ImmA/IrrE family metallo-endopeptidase [Streptosporangium algeriense]|uniref:ImmA/IrrE family metallo-endopeptidase n=1 Tax=Streptosporangium algeriense TaxID=1682748 RepID=A0ABW3DJW0_9ACTN
MPQSRREQITLQASELLKTHGVESLPIPVEQIATASGIQIVRSAAEWSESGFLLREPKRTIIGINSRNAPKRQRFTIAHELGHWTLHEGRPLIVDQSVMINKRDNISSQATSREEIEANQFAAELLMPRWFFPESINTHMKSGIGSRDELIAALAREFDVSNDAMGWRLTNLGILSS